LVEEYRPKHLFNVIQFLKVFKSEDFYITDNNERKIICDEKTLKKFIKETRSILVVEEVGDIQGIIGIWKSFGNVERFYIKIDAIDEKVADALLTSLLWNNRKYLHVKIKKDSNFLKVFKNKGFEFRGDRGREVLLILNNQYRKPPNG
jgi:hypothetical protein